MERIIRGRSATLSHTFEVDGVAQDPSPDTATVAITRADGTALVPAGSVGNAGTGVVTLTLTPAETALLDTLTVVWTATFGGQAQTFTDRVEIAGDVLFTVAEAKARTSMASLSSAAIATLRIRAEQYLERECGAFVPRYAYEPVDGNAAATIFSPRPFLRSVRSATIDDVAVTVSDIEVGANILYLSSGWTFGRRNVVLGYEHGRDFPEQPVIEAALDLAGSYVESTGTSGIDPRTTRVTTAEGIMDFGSHPVSVDRIFRDYGMNVGIA